jgi:predicted transcriptional regulator
MGQDEVLVVFQKNKGKWISSGKIAESVDLSLGSITKALQGLHMRGYISRKEIRTRYYLYFYDGKDHSVEAWANIRK